jgi:Acyltransferase family
MTATTVLSATQQPTPPPLNATSPRYNVSIGYLRAFLTLLVVAHHAALAYHPFAPPPPASLIGQPPIWAAFPVVDPQRWSGFALLTSFNDIFFMALMFFISGPFVWNSLQRKGAGGFIRDRALRLGLPFIPNACGIYLTHYAFVSWLQLALVKSHRAAIAKGWLVFLGALLLSWGTTAGLRRIPLIARLI